MLESMSKRMGAAGARVAQADDETLYGDIVTLAQRHDYPLAARILSIAELEHWTVQRTALALAYSHMILSNEHAADLKDMLNFMQRPIIITKDGIENA